MGKSESIQDKIKSDQEFKEFMKGLEADAKAKEVQILGDIDTLVQRHYEKNNWDNARFFGDRNSDYQNYSDWSLDRITKIIDSIGNALKGGDFPSKDVPGSKDADKSTLDEVKEFLPGFAGDYDLIIARVQALISGVLTQFASSSSASQKTSLKDMPLSGGMHLFFGSSGQVYTNSTFFTNQFIGSFQIVFETYMSVDEAKAIALKQILETTDVEIKMLNDLIVKIRAAQNKELEKLLKEGKLKEWTSTSDTFNEMRESVSKERDKLVKEYDKYKKVTDKVEQLLPYLDLHNFGYQSSKGTHSLNEFFHGWELGVAKRYLQQGQQALSHAE